MIFMVLVLMLLLQAAWAVAAIVSLAVLIRLQRRDASKPAGEPRDKRLLVARIVFGFVVCSALTFGGYFFQDPETRVAPAVGLPLCGVLSLLISVAVNLVLWSKPRSSASAR